MQAILAAIISAIAALLSFLGFKGQTLGASNIHSLERSIFRFSFGRRLLPRVGPDREFRVSATHAKRMAKRFESLVLISIYEPSQRRIVRRAIDSAFSDGHDEHIFDSEIPLGTEVEIALSCKAVSCSDPIVRKVSDKPIKVEFTLRPDDDCTHGMHLVQLTVSAADGNKQNYLAKTFPIFVTDFVFDHVSQPAFSKVAGVVAGITAAIMFVLTYLQQLDTTFGVAAGTSAGMISTAVFGRFFLLFSRRQEHATA